MRKSRRWWRLSLLWSLMAALWMVGCVGTGPRFTPEVQKSFRDHDMRRMETARLKIYYPEHRADEARKVAARLEQCLEDLEEETGRNDDWGLVPVFLPEVEFNNAYVMYGPGQDPHMVVPTHFTANIFGQFGYTPSASAVGCHEMVHYVHMIQIHGFFRAVNRFFGPSINPQTGFDLWFFEGLATYYESQLVDGVGRQGSPIWEAYFAAGIAEDRLDGGRLSHYDRTVPYGGHYLVGAHFVEYLVEEYGEEALWQVVRRQGTSILYPFAVSLRFRRVYGKPLNALIDDFERAMRERYPRRTRPDGQQRLDYIGRNAQFETGPGGLQAIFSSDLDRIAAIEVYDAHGQRLLRREVPDVLPGRTIVTARAIEALRFSPDGEGLYFLAHHLDSAEPRTTLMGLDIATNRLTPVRDHLQAVGGDLSPDGGYYYVASAQGNRVRFSRFNLDDQSASEPAELFTLPAGAYVGWIRICPQGTRVALTLMEDEEWSVAVLSLEDGQMLGRWTTGEPHQPVFDAVWVGDENLLFSASDGERVQVMTGDMETGNLRKLSDVPYLAVNPRVDGEGMIRFLNREGWGWSLDRLDTVGRATTAARWESGQEARVEGYEDTGQSTFVADDRPYSQLDGLFIPRLRVPMLSVTTAPGGGVDQVILSLGMSGYDELGFHNWAVQGQWEFANEELSGALSYVNAQLAPWYLALQLADMQSQVAPIVDGEGGILAPATTQRDRIASVQALRLLYGMPVYGQFRAAEFLREDTVEGGEDRRRLVGPEIGGEYRAGRTTAYGGAQWLFGLSALAAGYSTALGSDFDFTHLRTQLELRSPLPLSKRHRLRFSGRVRALPGVPDDEPLMRIGGLSNYEPIVTTGGERSGPVSQQLVPPAFLFQEPLRGYEDFGLIANQVAIADLDYRLPLIIDWGRASLTSFLPSYFIHEAGIEAFAAAATRFDGGLHAAVGASADLRMTFWVIPFSFRYQVAQRLVDDEQMVHTLGLGIGF